MDTIKKPAFLYTVIYVVIIILFAVYGVGQGASISLGVMPNLDAKPIVAKDTDPLLVKSVQSRIEKLVGDIKKDPGNYSDWLDLATAYQNVGDYEGALKILLYVIHENPRSLVAYNNLGNLYHFYLKDYKKAEKAFLKVVELDPSYIAGYRNLYDLYRLSFKDDAKAIAILEQGLSYNPNNLELFMVEGAQYLIMGDKAKARLYFEKALDEAKKGEDAEMIEYIQAQITPLK